MIKIGGSVITDKSEKFSLKRGTLNQVADELASTREEFVLVHGGGSFGHPMASKYDIASGYSADEQLTGFSETRQAMEDLNSKVVGALIKAGRPSISIQTSACTVAEGDEIVSMDLQPVKKLLDLGIAPVLYGDGVVDLKKGMTVLSGDQLIGFLAQELGASRVIVGVDAEGICTGDPKREENVELIPEITPKTWEDISSSISLPVTDDVTGGMKNKVEVLLDLARKGIESQVINATKPGILEQAIRGDREVGTKVTRK